MEYTKDTEEIHEKSAIQFDLDGDNLKIMKTAGYTPIRGNFKNGLARVVNRKGARFHAYVYPTIIYLHYDDVCGYKHKTKPHSQLIKGEINRIKSFEEEVNRYIKTNRRKK